MTKETKQRQKTENDVMLADCGVIVIFLTYGEFGANHKPDSGHIACIFINSKFISYKNWKQKLKISNKALTLLIWVKVLFSPKNADNALVLKSTFYESTYVCILTYQISSF